MITAISDRAGYSWEYDPSNQSFTRIKNGKTTNFKIVHVLGEGFFSRVCAIAPVNGGKMKAVKLFIEDEKTRFQGGIKNAFLTEMKNLNLIPPNTVGVELKPKAYIQTEEFLMIIKPLYEGFIGDKKMTQAMILESMDQLLQGIEFLIKNQISDLDVTQLNILYRKERWDIIDFGYKQNTHERAVESLGKLFKKMISLEDSTPPALTEFINRLAEGQIKSNLHKQFLASTKTEPAK